MTAPLAATAAAAVQAGLLAARPLRLVVDCAASSAAACAAGAAGVGHEQLPSWLLYVGTGSWPAGPTLRLLLPLLGGLQGMGCAAQQHAAVWNAQQLHLPQRAQLLVPV